MHLNINTTRLIALTAVFAIILPSCKKFVEPDTAPGLIEQSSVFASDQAALSTVMGLYSKLRSVSNGLTNGGLSLYTALSADEIYNTGTNAAADVFYRNSIPSTNATITTNFWSLAYKNIYQANAIIEGLNGSVSITDSLKKQLDAEAKLIRAVHYFYLANLFGDVPLILTTAYGENAIMPRTPAKQVNDQVIADMLEVKNILKPNYTGSNKARPNKYAAEALLSRAYLYKGDWAKAEAEANLVINSLAYRLETNLNSIFLSGSNETIWQITSDVANTSEGAVFIPSSSSVMPPYALTPNLLSAFSSGDKRKLNWLGSSTVNGQTYFYPYKYKQRTGTTVTEQAVVIRLAEVYLIRAEARAQQDNIDGAIADLTIIRTRAGADNLSPTLMKPEVLNAIEKERQAELFCEWGHRWLDLKRTNRANEVLTSVKAPNWQPTDVLYPIPDNEIKRNSFLTQNPGY